MDWIRIEERHLPRIADFFNAVWAGGMRRLSSGSGAMRPMEAITVTGSWTGWPRRVRIRLSLRSGAIFQMN